MTHLCTAARELCPVCWRCEGCCHCYEDQLAQLTDVLLHGGPSFSDPPDPWTVEVAHRYAKAAINAGWRPPNVPPASAPSVPPGPAHEAVTPVPPAGGAQPLHGQDWRDAMRKATADLHKAQRNQRGKRPGKPITGYVLPPDGER